MWTCEIVKPTLLCEYREQLRPDKKKHKYTCCMYNEVFCEMSQFLTIEKSLNIANIIFFFLFIFKFLSLSIFLVTLITMLGEARSHFD